MSGSTIGGVVGGVVGFMVGGPAGAQWGWMIGSVAGGVLMPENYEGPRLGEATRQTAQDGVPLIYGYGTFTCAGNLIWVGDVVEHRHKESAKGGPTQTSYTYTVSYAICVCKGPISGYKIIKRNGKIVYDARTDAELTALGYSSQDIAEARAAQAEFLQRATLYYGAPGQMPDPTMVAALGADEVPAYTGIAYIVLKDDETREGEVAQYEFVVATCGERSDELSPLARLLITGGSRAAMADATSTPEFELVPEDVTEGALAPTPAYYGGVFGIAWGEGLRESTDGGAGWYSAAYDWSVSPSRITGGPAGWATYPLGNGSISAPVIGQVDGTYYAFAQGSRYLAASTNLTTWQKISDGLEYPGQNWRQAIQSMYDIQGWNDGLIAAVRKNFGQVEARLQIRGSSDGGIFWPTLYVDVPYEEVTGHPFQIEIVDGRAVALATGSVGVWTSENGWSAPVATGLSTISDAGQYNIARQITSANGRVFVIGQGESAGLAVVSEDYGLTWSEPFELPFDAKGIVAGLPYGSDTLTPMPDAPGFYIDRNTGQIVGPPGTQIDPCAPTLGSIVADQCERRGVTSRDVSELTDTVLGYRVAAPSTPQKNIQGLQPGYFFVASEFDGNLVFAKRGRDLTFALTYDDFVERDGDPIQWERTQERDFARKVTVAYVDPETSYAPTTQQAERRAATIAAEGENTVELPVTGTKDWAAQVADKSIKVAWGEVDECTFHVTIDHAELVTGAEGTVPYTDGEPTVVRIERIEDEGLVRMVTARKTRRSLYESNASGASKPLPRFPGSNVRGPTDGLLLNIPVLIDQDDRPGIHWAAAGMLSGWQGGQLQIRRAGQWVVAGTASASAGLGRLVNALPAHAGDVDNANVLRVQFNEALASVSWVNLLQERNPLAILRDDGTAEIVQFQTAVEVSPNVFDLTTLLRGRLATVPDDHPAGARVVFLDNRVQYASLEPTDLGATLEYRFVSNGTDPDAAPIQTIELTTMESQREWPVSGLAVEQDGDDYIVTWLRRDRLGTDVLPIRSAHWAGYEVSYSHAGGSGSVVVLTETHTFTLPGATDITFSVAQLNQYTGAGPAQTVTIP